MINRKVRQEIVNLISTFPDVFGLQAFPGQVFRMSYRASHFYEGQIILYTESQREGWWALHTRGTEKELRAQVISLRENKNSAEAA